MDSRTLPYHWDDRRRLHSDHLYLNGVYEKYLEALVPRLNEIHGMSQSARFWRVVIGPWLRYFIEIFYDRFLSISAAADQSSVSDTLIVDTAQPRPPLDFTDFNRFFISDSYNQYLYSWLIAHTKSVPFHVHQNESEPGKISDSGTTIRERVSLLVSRLGRTMPPQWNSISLLTTQLPHLELLRLNFALRQFPWIVGPAIPIPTVPVSLNLRQTLAVNVGDNSFEQLLGAIIPEQIPVVHVEAFADLRTQSLQAFPAKPEVIVTSASESFDEGFKVWAATHIDNGATFSMSQHGGGLGSALWMSTEDHQIQISDRYYSWGWSDERLPSVRPMPGLKLVGIEKRIRYSKSGRILWVLTSIPRYSYRMLSIPVAGQVLAYLDDQFRLASALSTQIRSRITVRLYPGDYGWNEELRWRDRFPDLDIYKGTASMDRQISESSLFIGTYNATTFLETLAANFPTIIFWNPQHWELRPSAEPFYELLREVGIFHTSTESAAAKLEEIWIDPMKWWKTADVQRVRQQFCDRFARTSTDWLQEWKSELSR